VVADILEASWVHDAGIVGDIINVGDECSGEGSVTYVGHSELVRDLLEDPFVVDAETFHLFASEPVVSGGLADPGESY